MDPNILILLGLHTLLTAHLSAILSESRSTVQDSIQSAVDQVLERHHQAAQRPAGKLKTRGSREEAPARAGKNRQLCAPPRTRALQSPPRATRSPPWPPPLPEDHKPQQPAAGPRRPTQRALRAAWRYRGGRRRDRRLRAWAAAAGSSPPSPLLPQDLWLQEVSNLSEWLSPGRRL
ncbi:hypothetical protein NN561_004421 [Cricetulus griseus]